MNQKRGRKNQLKVNKRKPVAPKATNRFISLFATFFGKHTFVWWLGTLVPAAAVLFLGYWLASSVPVDFVADLRPNKPVTIQYSGSFLEKKSPACGCYGASPDEWRGVSFVTRRLRLGSDRQNAAGDVNTFMLFPAYPTNVELGSAAFRLEATMYVLDGNLGVKVDPRALAAGDLRHLGRRIIGTKRLGIGPTIDIVSENALTLESLGDVPLGAWLPSDNSALSLAAEGNDSGHFRIKETIAAHTAKPDKEGFLPESYFTVVDFVGPVIVGWTRGSVEIFGVHGFYATNASLGIPKNSIIVFVIRVPYALRTAIGNINTVPTLTPTDGAHLVNDGMFFPAPTRGVVFGELLRDDSYPVDPAQVERLGSKEVERCDELLYLKQFQCMWFRNPPLPAIEAFNVFGQVDSVTFEGATGSVMIGASHYDINPSVPVTLNATSAYESERGDLSIPIQLDPRKLTVSYDFAAHGEVTINGESVTQRLQNQQLLVNVIGAALAIASIGSWIFARLRIWSGKSNAG